MIYATIIPNIQKYLGKSSGWIIDSVNDHNISISEYNPLAGSSYIKLPKELDHPKKGLINIQNIDDNECFKWTRLRYLNPADNNLRRITKVNKKFIKILSLKEQNFQEKLENSQNWKKNFIGIKVFCHGNKRKHPIYESRKLCEEKHVDSLFIKEEGKRHYTLIKDFNTIMYDHTLHGGKKYFCRYGLRAFSSEEILKRHIKDIL